MQVLPAQDNGGGRGPLVGSLLPETMTPVSCFPKCVTEYELCKILICAAQKKNSGVNVVLGRAVLTKLRGSFAAGHPCFVEHSYLHSWHMYCDQRREIEARRTFHLSYHGNSFFFFNRRFCSYVGNTRVGELGP